MKTKEEIREWILGNCINHFGYIDLRDMDFGGHRVILRGMKAEAIYQYEHKAKYIYQSGHEAQEIYQSYHEAQVIYQHCHKAHHVTEGSHTKTKRKMTLGEIEKELGYEIELEEEQW